MAPGQGKYGCAARDSNPEPDRTICVRQVWVIGAADGELNQPAVDGLDSSRRKCGHSRLVGVFPGTRVCWLSRGPYRRELPRLELFPPAAVDAGPA